MRNTGLDEAQAGIKIAGRNISNLRYAEIKRKTKITGWSKYKILIFNFLLIRKTSLFPLVDVIMSEYYNLQKAFILKKFSYCFLSTIINYLK